MSVLAYVQACFNREGELQDALDACETAAEVDAVDLSGDWPSRALPGPE